MISEGNGIIVRKRDKPDTFDRYDLPMADRQFGHFGQGRRASARAPRVSVSSYSCRLPESRLWSALDSVGARCSLT